MFNIHCPPAFIDRWLQIPWTGALSSKGRPAKAEWKDALGGESDDLLSEKEKIKPKISIDIQDFTSFKIFGKNNDHCSGHQMSNPKWFDVISKSYMSWGPEQLVISCNWSPVPGSSWLLNGKWNPGAPLPAKGLFVLKLLKAADSDCWRYL